MLCEYFDIFVVTYFNNILIYLKTLEEHVNYIKKVLECLTKKSLKLKLEKYEFY